MGVRTKIVINNCFGGFGLSDVARSLFEEKTGERFTFQCPRHHPALVSVVEEMGRKASGSGSELKVCLVYGTRYLVTEYDGNEDYRTPDDEEDWIVADMSVFGVPS